jgi:hypothetical protein
MTPVRYADFDRILIKVCAMVLCDVNRQLCPDSEQSLWQRRSRRPLG